MGALRSGLRGLLVSVLLVASSADSQEGGVEFRVGPTDTSPTCATFGTCCPGCSAAPPGNSGPTAAQYNAVQSTTPLFSLPSNNPNNGFDPGYEAKMSIPPGPAIRPPVFTTISRNTTGPAEGRRLGVENASDEHRKTFNTQLGPTYSNDEALG